MGRGSHLPLPSAPFQMFRRLFALLTRLADQRDESFRQQNELLKLIQSMRASEAHLMGETLRTAQVVAEASKAQAEALGSYFAALQAGYQTTQAPTPPTAEAMTADALGQLSDTYMSLYGPAQAFDGPQYPSV